jgi:hypothetical protein
MTDTNPSSDENAQVTISDEEFFAARRETMGEDYPGDEAMRQFDREADADFAEWTREQHADDAAAPAAAEQAAQEAASAPGDPEPELAAATEPKDWNAGDWLRETFKNDPGFKDLSPEDFAKLETMADEMHGDFEGDIKEWAGDFQEKWVQELPDRVKEGMESSPELKEFAETHLADGKFDEADKAALAETVKTMEPGELAGAIRPTLEGVREMQGEILDGAEMIVENAVEDIDAIIEARAEMPGGDAPEVQALDRQLDEAPALIEEGFQFERQHADYEWGKVEDRLDMIEAGTDPKDLPADTDTYQVDDNEDQYEAADA